MPEPTTEQKALFYHLASDHHVVTADYQGATMAKLEELHSALHDLIHNSWRVPEKPEPYRISVNYLDEGTTTGRP